MWARENRPSHWGDCNLDYPVEKIVSPYPYKTAEEHYKALLAEAKKAGGPTVHTRQTLPDWDGWYQRGGREDQWIWGRNAAGGDDVSLLTPEYQKRMVQMKYHEAVSNAPQWMASFCYPEGFMRWWSEASHGGPIEVMMNPNQVQFLTGIADNLLRRVLVGRTARAEGPAVVRRDGRVLERQHARRVDGERAGLDALALDVRVQQPDGGRSRRFAERRRQDDHRRGDVLRPGGVRAAGAHRDAVAAHAAARTIPKQRFYLRRVPRAEHDRQRPRRPADAADAVDEGYIDYFGRPWAQNWEENFEQGWEKP